MPHYKCWWSTLVLSLVFVPLLASPQQAHPQTNKMITSATLREQGIIPDVMDNFEAHLELKVCM